MDDTPEDALKSERRRDILREVRKRPGIPIGELRERVDIARGVFYFHFRKLERSGLVETRDTGTHKRVYLTGKAPPPDEGPLSMETARKVAEAFLARPGRTTGQIAVHVGLTRRMVLNHVRSLMDAGLLEQVEESPPTYRPTPALEKALRGRE